MRSGRNPAQGRPLGLLAAFLLLNLCADVVSKETHKHPLTLTRITLMERRRGREWLMALPDGPQLAEFERPQRDGEGPEPETDP